jgi:DNA-binding LytR/AlgR family response regulator
MMKDIDKVENLLQRNTSSNVEVLLSKVSVEEGKKHFLVFKNNKYLIIETGSIAFIYIRYASATIMTFQGEEYPVVQSLDQLQSSLPAKQFFRLNRQYLINFKAIKEVEHYFARKLLVKLILPTSEKLLIRKERKRTFLHWLENS